MPKKKPSGNGFFYFMLELKNTQGRGLQNKNMQQISEIAGPMWAQMSKDQRKKYDEQAKSERQGGKMTSSGRDLEEAQREEDQQQESIVEMRMKIRDDLAYLHTTETLGETLFFIVHINNFCLHDNENRWYPAEIAVSAFSLIDGVKPQNIFHRYVKPGKLPLGFASEAKLHAEKTHQMERPTSDENNCKEVFRELLYFLETRSKDRQIILYADENHMEMVTTVMDTWCYDYNVPYQKVKVYSLQYFFLILKNTCAHDTVWHSETFSRRELEKDLYDYTPKISCEFHEVAGVQVHCSKSVVTRYTYIICDNCCEYLHIQLVRGCHVPEDAMTTPSRRRTTSGSSIASSNSTRSNTRTITDDDTSTLRSMGRSEYESSNLSVYDDFPTLGPGMVPSRPPDTWEKFNPNPSELSSQVSYASAIRTASGSGSAYPAIPSLVSGMDMLGVSDSESEYPSLGRGRGRGRGRPAGRGRGSAYDRKKPSQ